MSDETLAVAKHEKPALVVGQVSGGLVPRTMEEGYRLASIIAASGMAPKGMEKVETVFAAIQMGMEIGLAPMQAVQNIAVINGRPAVWGDAALGLVLASGLLEEFSETPIKDAQGHIVGYTCRAMRRGNPEPSTHTFTIDDAKQAKLWMKTGRDGQPTPWVHYPQRMMQMRARAWVLRDRFADVLKGLSIREEVQDIVDTTATVETIKPGRASFGPPPRQMENIIHPPAPPQRLVDVTHSGSVAQQTQELQAPAEMQPAAPEAQSDQSGEAAGMMERDALAKQIQAALDTGNDAVKRMVEKAKLRADVTDLGSLNANTLADIAASI